MAKGLRYLPISDAKMKRPNFLFTTQFDRLSPATLAVHGEIKETVKYLVDRKEWIGVQLL
jgi:hypothetical protein